MKLKDEWAIVLDFLPEGHPSQRGREPVAQIIGEKYFSLLEIVPREDISLSPQDKVYIGEGKRDKVKYIKKSINYHDLTGSSKVELEDFIDETLDKQENRFIKFFNESGPLTTRMHSLEVLPGVGKKHLWEIIDARKEKKFESYEDLKNRVSLMPDPKKILKKRIIEEIEEEKKHYIFALTKRKERR